MGWAGVIAALAVWSFWVSRRVPRARIWVGLVSLGYFAPLAYYELGGPLQFMPNILMDTCTCLVIDRLARERWELWLFNIYRLSVFVSVVAWGTHICMGATPQLAYAISLEAINWAALLLIGGTGILEASYRGWGIAIRGRPRPLFRAWARLRSSRSTHSWQNRK
jgi:hypothetical protein